MLVGLLKSAEFDKNKHFKAVIETDKGDWTRDVISVGVQTKCAEYVGKRVAATLTQNVDNKYFHISDIKLAEQAPAAPKPAPAGGKDAQERPLKAEDVYKEPDWDSIGLKKTRCKMFEAACNFFSGNKTATIDNVLTLAKAGEKYVYETTLVDEAIKLGAKRE